MLLWEDFTVVGADLLPIDFLHLTLQPAEPVLLISSVGELPGS